jgi:HEPN domain-containing protein
MREKSVTKNILVSKLMKKANSDLKIAIDELNTPEPAIDMVCFHIQQFIEKYLKSFLVYKEIKAPRTHSISFLLNKCIETDGEFEKYINTNIINIEDCAVEIRYDESDFLDMAFIQDSLKILYDIKEFIEKKVSL